MSIPSFKVNSKPQLSHAEYQAQEAQSRVGGGGNFLDAPGTYDLTIKSAKFKETPSDKDNAWISLQMELESPEGKSIKHSLLVPTECRNSFLFGARKDTFAIRNVQQFLAALGVEFVWETGMETIGQVFGNPEQLIMKTVKGRCAYKGPHIKYVSKGVFQVVEKDHVTIKIDGSYADKNAALAAARELGLNIDQNAGYLNIQEFFASKEPKLSLVPAEAAVEIDLPF